LLLVRVVGLICTCLSLCGALYSFLERPFTTSKSESKRNASLPNEPWSNLIVKDLSGKELKVSSHWENQPAVVTLVRRFG